MWNRIVDVAEYKKLLSLLRSKIDCGGEGLQVYVKDDVRVIIMTEEDNVYAYSSGERKVFWLNHSSIILPN